MGEIADGIINGDFDEETGEYLGEGDGYPRSFAREAREKRNTLQPERMKYAKQELQKIGIVINFETNTRLEFMFEGEKIMFYPYTGWHTGKSIVDGRGIQKLLKQLKPKKNESI